MTWTPRFFVFLAAVLVLTGWTVPAEAQIGLRGGLSVNPDQFYFGIHTETGPVFEKLRFRPNAEVGFGNDVTVVALNGEFIFPFELDNGTPLYVGAGPAINILSFDRINRNDTTVEPGLNFLLGFHFDRNYFAELKVGALDSPEVKIGIGYTFPSD